MTGSESSVIVSGNSENVKRELEGSNGTGAQSVTDIQLTLACYTQCKSTYVNDYVEFATRC